MCGQFVTVIAAFLLERFPDSNIRWRNAIIGSCNDFVESGLADTTYIAELTSGDDGKFWSRVSEALISSHLKYAGMTLDNSPRDEGPDFLLMDGDRKIWIEVISPTPSGVPDGWIKSTSQKLEVFTLPHESILLRWTSAIKEKAEKLIGKSDGSYEGYISKGIVAPEDAYVIAINGCQLHRPGFIGMEGISQFPYAVEAVFPVGPFQVFISPDTMKQVGADYQYRPEIININGSPVPADTFLDPKFEQVSAIWAVDIDGSSVMGNRECLAVVHNPNAMNPIPTHLLPAYDEYVATPNGPDEMVLNRQDGRLKISH